jgi:hypothetical protein
VDREQFFPDLAFRKVPGVPNLQVLKYLLN